MYYELVIILIIRMFFNLAKNLETEYTLPTTSL